MKLFYLFLFFACFSTLSAQDTVRVKTFTWPNAARVGVFDFPDDPGQTYRKIWMRYNMRCKNGAAGGCAEWDYSCNTFVTDSSRIDSTRQQSPEYVVGGYNAAGFVHSGQVVTPYPQAFLLQNTVYTPAANDVKYQIGTFPFLNTGSIVPTFKYQVMLPASVLANLPASAIKGLELKTNSDAGSLNYLKVRMQAVAANTQFTAPVENLWQEVFYNHVTKAANVQDLNLPFSQAFNWNGTSNILLEISYTQPEQASAIQFNWTNSNLGALVTQPTADKALYFHGRGQMQVPAAKCSQITKDLTVMFWSYGLPESLPANTSILEGVDASNRRQLNIHLPWSDGQIYFDCGNNGSGYDRINKAVPTADIEGRWNHYAFTKDAAGNMRIYINGVLFQSGTGLTKPIDIQRLVVGSAINGAVPYTGGLNDLSIWKRALTVTEISKFRYGLPGASDAAYADMVYGYSFDQDANEFVAQDQAANPLSASLLLPKRRLVRGQDRWVNMVSTNQLPEVQFWQGSGTATSTSVLVIDTTETQQQTTVIRQGVQQNALVQLDTSIVYPAGAIIAYDATGTPRDTLFYQQGTTTLNGLTLQHYVKRPAKYELVSLVTPYGNGLNLGVNGKTFMFDVTDFTPILKGKKRLSMEYGGENQEEIDLEFIFVKGTPERPVLDIQPIWPQNRGNIDGILADNIFEPRNILLKADAKTFKARVAITGHDQNGEFQSRNHYLNVNGGAKEFNFDVWKACGRNPIYPQGGTWIFDRAGWCPGMATDVREFEIANLVQPGTSVAFDYGVNGATMATANYLVNAQLVTYGAYTHSLDASLETILRPNNQRVEFERINPTCSQPMLVVRNSGSTPITSLKIAYNLKGGFQKEYQWSGNILPSQQTEITIPAPSAAFWLSGSNVFEAEIKEVNGTTDGNVANNTANAPFTQAKQLNFTEPMRMRLLTNAKAADNSYTIKDAAGTTVISRSGLTNTTTYTETIDFAPGCYTLNLEDTGNDGLSFWFYPNNGTGSISFQRQVNSTWVNAQSFNADFGAGLQFDFVVGAIVGTDDLSTTRRISTYPNPANETLNLEFTGFENTDVQLRLVDMTGRVIRQENNLRDSQLSWSVGHLPQGLYTLQCTDGLRNYTQTVAIMHD
jgi:Concanavalin A-like lectin/glucanases superfamily/Peptide-N-glycosidase F, C terminal/Secretion system C-terminal sorting domain